ncbi:MAG: ABC transporter permease [Pirellulales bacterium]|nr:ABC transporter permease [Pirellulales bacterium]
MTIVLDERVNSASTSARTEMNLGLTYKSVRETWALTLFCAIGVLLFEAVISYVVITYAPRIVNFWKSLEESPILEMVSVLMGVDPEKFGGPDQLIALAWVHPVILATLWAHEITFCTRMPAGEVQRGTSDILLSWPVPRWTILVSECLVWMCSGALLFVMVAAGNRVGHYIADTDSPTPVGHILPVLVNFFALYLVVGGVAWLASVLTDRRGRAISVTFSVVIVSFLINFLVPFWKPAEHVAFLGLLHYYQPAAILKQGEWPLGNIVTLLSAGFVLWMASLFIFSRRNVSTS